jgi:hypothetical protein
MGYGGGGMGGDQRRQEAERKAAIARGTQMIDDQFAGFDDQFFNRRAGDYEDFAAPQIGQQYTKTGNSLTYALARAGLRNSSVAGQKRAALDLENAQQLRNVSDTGMAQANDLRQQVEGQRSNLMAQLNASADPGQASAAALRTAQAYQQPTSFSPITNVFEDWTRNYLANQTARAYDPAVQPMFSWNSNNGGSSRIVG